MRKFKQIPAGVSVALLAVPAFILPFLWEHLSLMERGAGLAVVVLLVALEVRAIYRDQGQRDQDRNRRDEDMKETIGRFEELLEVSHAHAESLRRIHSIVNDPVGSLKARAIRLSANLIDWIYKRLENEPRWDKAIIIEAPGMPTDEYLQAVEKSGAYARETMHFYLQRFARDVEVIRQEMTHQGIIDEMLNNACDDPNAGADTVLFIGQRIGELAEEITN